MPLGDWRDVAEMLNFKENGGFGEGEGIKEGGKERVYLPPKKLSCRVNDVFLTIRLQNWVV